MPDSLYAAIATSTGDGRLGRRAASDDGLINVILAIPPGWADLVARRT